MDVRLEPLTRVAAVILLVMGCLLVLQPFVTALLCAAIVCFSTWPIYEWLLLRVGGRPSLAALVMTMLLLLVFVLPVAFLALTLADTAPEPLLPATPADRTGASQQSAHHQLRAAVEHGGGRLGHWGVDGSGC